MSKRRHTAVAVSLSAAFALPACGGNDSTSTTTATAAAARAEAAAMRAALSKALAQVKAGDRRAAEDTVAEGYLQHFEEVEGPLEKVDDELNEELEDSIKVDLRQKIRSNAPAAEIEKLVNSLDADLAEAEQKLQ